MAKVTIQGLTDEEAKALTRFFERGHLQDALEDFRVSEKLCSSLKTLETFPVKKIDTQGNFDPTHENNHIIQYRSDIPF